MSNPTVSLPVGNVDQSLAWELSHTMEGRYINKVFDPITVEDELFVELMAESDDDCSTSERSCMADESDYESEEVDLEGESEFIITNSLLTLGKQ